MVKGLLFSICYAAACQSVVASGSSLPHLRLSRVVVPSNILQQFLAGKLARRDGSSVSLPRAGATQKDRAEPLSLIISYCLSKLAKSYVKRLRRQHFQLCDGGVGVAHEDSTLSVVTPRRVNRRKFPNTDSEEEEDEGESTPDQGGGMEDANKEGEEKEKEIEEESSSQPPPELEVRSTVVD